MRTHLYRAVALTVVLLVICGVGYPVAGWALSQLAFRHQADGSISANGSTSIGQPWSVVTACTGGVATIPRIDPTWFQGRPDCDNPLGLNGTSGSSGATNLGPTSSALVAITKGYLAAWHRVGVDPTADLVTSSGSGLDPDITPADALVQIPMILRSHPTLTGAELRSLIQRTTAGAQLGFLGSPTVNVLQLNEGLQALVARPR